MSEEVKNDTVTPAPEAPAAEAPAAPAAEASATEAPAAGTQQTTSTEQSSNRSEGSRPEGGNRSEGGDRRPQNRPDRGRRDGGRPRFRRKVCRFCEEPNTVIDYKKPEVLERFITDRGKILPRRVTGTCAKHQRAVAVAIKRARIIALLPFVEK